MSYRSPEYDGRRKEVKCRDCDWKFFLSKGKGVKWGDAETRAVHHVRRTGHSVTVLTISDYIPCVTINEDGNENQPDETETYPMRPRDEQRDDVPPVDGVRPRLTVVQWWADREGETVLAEEEHLDEDNLRRPESAA